MEDEKILERGGTEEDINGYAHDVGGACGAIYGGTCNYCGKTDESPQKDIHVFVCEDDTVAKEIIKFFEKGKVTYAAVFKESERGEIVSALDRIQDGENNDD